MATTAVKVRQYSTRRPAQLIREQAFVYTPVLPATTTFGFRGICFNGSQLVFCTTRSLLNIDNCKLVFVDPYSLTPRGQVDLSGISASFLDAMDVCYMGGRLYGILTADNGGGFPSFRRDIYVADGRTGNVQRTALNVVSTTARGIDWTGQGFVITDQIGFGERVHDVSIDGRTRRTTGLVSAGSQGPGIVILKDAEGRPGETVLTKQDPSLFAVRQFMSYSRPSWTATGLFNLGTADNPTEQPTITASPSYYWEFDSSN